ncbi:PREDICTED: uncharacterized protein LOC104824502 [Tarenaya hassleriana]|uniref:uncharacterized protein LOC104824502 n=1 Tax=Tarenaya hassleriana TaxID=28532 RepID=UPI00053C8309|nr:PREDICTED: uncharacterized protein LOC104824502 [Tarenaya hassleriana]
MLSLEAPQNPMQFKHAQMVSYAGNNGGGGGDQQHHYQMQMQPPVKPSPYLYASKPKQSSSLSDEDEHGSGPGSGYNPEDGAGANGKRKFSQWQRVKWTDTMVKLLIMAVFYMGDEAGSSEPTADPAKKRLSSSSPAGGGMVQKKGKWKSVSRAMMEKGFYVSPQQCEDKFNDLNKRYKRVNDMLGKGTACRVVENQGLLDAMDIPLKLKEEVKKLLHSKHLFFREMCAYHNSCGHLNADPPQTQMQTQTQSCFHPAAAAAAAAEESEPETAEDSESGDESSEEVGRKRRKRASESMAVTVLMEEAGKVAMEEKKEWMKMKMVEVEMEKQRLKWIRFKGKKEREMEKTTLQIQRRRLENERMLLLLRRMGMELGLQSGRIG